MTNERLYVHFDWHSLSQVFFEILLKLTEMYRLGITRQIAKGYFALNQK